MSWTLEQLRLGKCGETQAGDLLFSLQLHGVLRVILEPLMGDLPIVGAVSMFFIKRPVRRALLGDGRHGTMGFGKRAVQTGSYGHWEVRSEAERARTPWCMPVLPGVCPDSSALLFQTLDINWTGMTNLLDIPGLRYWAPSQVPQSWAEASEIKQDTLLCASESLHLGRLDVNSRKVLD